MKFISLIVYPSPSTCGQNNDYYYLQEQFWLFSASHSASLSFTARSLLGSLFPLKVPRYFSTSTSTIFSFFSFFCQSQLAHSLLGNFATKKTVILTAQWSSYLLFVSGMTQLLCYSQPFSIWRFYLAYATYGSLRHKKKAGNKSIPAKSFPFSLKPISISVTRIGLRPICLQKDRLHIIVLVLLAALRVMRIARS